MLSPKELLREQTAQLAISYDTVQRGQEQSSEAISKLSGKEGWLFRKVENDLRSRYAKQLNGAGLDGQYLKVWTALYDGRLLFSDLFAHDASILELFEKRSAYRNASRVAQHLQQQHQNGIIKSDSKGAAYFSGVVGGFFSRRNSADKRNNANYGRAGSSDATTITSSSGSSGVSCFGYLDLLSVASCEIRTQHTSAQAAPADQKYFSFQVKDGDTTITFAALTNSDREEWVNAIRQAINGTMHSLPLSSLHIPATARKPSVSKVTAGVPRSLSGGVSQSVSFPQMEGYLQKTSTVAELNSTLSEKQPPQLDGEEFLCDEEGLADDLDSSSRKSFKSNKKKGSSHISIWKGLKAKAGGATRRRWFVLEQGVLGYYSTKPQQDVSDADSFRGARDTLNISGAEVWIDEGSAPSDCGVVLHLALQNGRLLKLGAASAEEAEQWLESLSITIDLLQEAAASEELEPSSPLAPTAIGPQHPQRRMNIHDRFDPLNDESNCSSGVEVDRCPRIAADTAEGQAASTRSQSADHSIALTRSSSQQFDTVRRTQRAKTHSLISSSPTFSKSPDEDATHVFSDQDLQQITSSTSEHQLASGLHTIRKVEAENKSAQTMEMLSSCLQKNFMIRSAIRDHDDISSQQHTDLQPLIDVMQERLVAPGEVIMWQGTSGNDFYVIEKGLCDVIKDGQKIAQIMPGNAFGELALLNNSTRQATVRACECSRLWRLTRDQFRIIAARQEATRLSDKVSFLEGIELFSKLVPQLLLQVADVMVLRSYATGDRIIKQGEPGDCFYMIVSGRVVVTQKKSFASSSVELTRLGPGKFFGELALFKDAPRAATVSATTDVKCWTVDRDSFLSLLGSMDELMQESLGLHMLQQVKLLESLTTQQLRLIARRLTTADYVEGETIITQGDVGDCFYMISEGEVGIQVNHVQVATIGKGSFFGEMSLLTNERRSATVVALQDCQCLVLSRSDFDELLGPLDELIQYEAERRKDQQQLVQLARENENRRFSLMGSLRRMSDSFFSTPSSEAGSTSPVPVSAVLDSSDSGKRSGALDSADDMMEKLFARSIPRNSLFTQTNNMFQDQLHNFIRVKRLGVGTFATVFLVRHDDTEKLYAIKMQHKQHLLETCQERSASYSERNIMLLLADSQFVASLYATLQDKKSIYFIQQFVPGPDLWQYLYGRTSSSSNSRSVGDSTMSASASSKKMGGISRLMRRSAGGAKIGMPTAHCQFYAANVLAALSHMHEKDIVYRNLKPENLIIDSGGYLKFVDFGSSKRLRAGAKTHTLCGTAEYCAPEVILSKGHDKSVDFWGLGVLIYEMLTRNSLFSAPSLAQIFQSVIESKEWLHPILVPSTASASSPMKKGSLATTSNDSVGPAASPIVAGSPAADSVASISPRSRSRKASFSFSPTASPPSRTAKPSIQSQDSAFITTRSGEVSTILTTCSVDSNSKVLLSTLLSFNPHTRLGVLRGGTQDIWNSAFFKGITPEAVEKRLLKAPFIPEFDEDSLTAGDSFGDVLDVLDVIEDSDDYPDYSGYFDYSYF